MTTSGAEVSIPLSFVFTTGTAKKLLPDCIKSFCEQHTLNTKTILGFNKKLRFTEYCITPVKKLYVLGTAVPDPFKKNNLSDEHTENILIQRQGNNPFFISDKPEKEILSILWRNALWLTILGGILLILLIPLLVKMVMS